LASVANETASNARTLLWMAHEGFEDGEWRTAEVDLSLFAGKTVELRIVAVMGSKISVWWENDIAIDQLQILEPAKPTTVTTTMPPPALGANRSTCMIWGDPHIQVFDFKGAAASRRHIVNMLDIGDFSLVKSPRVNIQARYRTASWSNGQAATYAVAVGGAFLKDHVLIVEPMSGHITWDGVRILEKMPSEFEVRDLITARFVEGGATALRSKHAGRVTFHSVDLELPLGITMTLNRWKEHLDLLITMSPLEGGQDGHCGNLNGDIEDDDAKSIRRREGGPLSPTSSLFPADPMEHLSAEHSAAKTVDDCPPEVRKKAEARCADVVPALHVPSCVFDVCFGGGAYVQSDSVAITQMGTSFVAAPVKWSPNPDMCMGVSGGRPTNGSSVQLAECVDDHPDQLFLLPATGSGLIRWASHPHVCLDISAAGVAMQMRECEDVREMKFLVPSQKEGNIRWAADPSRCVEPGGHSGAKLPLRLGRCARHGTPSQVFYFE